MENNEIKISVTNITGDVFAVEAEEGQKIFEAIHKALSNNFKVVISFLNIKIITTAFLNTAIGQLYKDFSEEKIKNSLCVEDISDSGKITLKRVVDTAKLFYNDADRFKKMQKSIDDILKNK